MNDYKQGIDDLIHSSKHEIFHDGMDSAFSVGLHKLIGEHGKDVIIDLQYRLQYGRLPFDLASEALIQCGHIEDSNLEEYVIAFAYLGLRNKHSWIRDSAGLCLSSLDNPIAISQLKLAIASERNIQLHKNLDQVLDQLIATRIEYTKKALADGNP